VSYKGHIWCVLSVHLKCTKCCIVYKSVHYWPETVFGGIVSVSVYVQQWFWVVLVVWSGFD